MNVILVSAVALVDPDGRILLAQRPEGKSMAGLWEFPGGKVEPGETPEAALIRELKIGGAKINQRYRLAGVGGVGLLGNMIQHLLHVAVVGCDQHLAADLSERRLEPAQTFIECFHRLHGGIEYAGMAHHVAVRIVADDQVELC